MQRKTALTPELLVVAYSRGWFPMGDEKERITWHDPDPRAVFPLGIVRPNARFRRFLRNSGLHCTIDTAFEEVIRRCAALHGETWITEEMIGAYTELHCNGHAHSVETWVGDEPVGGIYGVAIGAAFFGESMFSLLSNAGKAAFYRLVEHLREKGFTLFDSQYLNGHTASLGAIEVPRSIFKTMLEGALSRPSNF